MNPLALASLGLGGLGAIGGIFNSFTSGNRIGQILSQEPTYKQSPYAAQRLGLAQSLLNARMPGAASMERNIYGNQANQLANVNRNATDASQALALGSAAQGQTNQAFQNLGTQEQQDYYNRLQNYTGAQQGMIAEGDKAYQDQVRKFQDMAGLRGAQMQNTQNAWNSVANLGFGGANALSFLNFGQGGQGGQGSVGNGYNANPYGSGNSYLLGLTPEQTTQVPGNSYMPNYISPAQSTQWINPNR